MTYKFGAASGCKFMSNIKSVS